MMAIRPVGEIERARDLLMGLMSDSVLLDRTVNASGLDFLKGSADALCWVLQDEDHIKFAVVLGTIESRLRQLRDSERREEGAPYQ